MDFPHIVHRDNILKVLNRRVTITTVMITVFSLLCFFLLSFGEIEFLALQWGIIVALVLSREVIKLISSFVMLFLLHPTFEQLQTLLSGHFFTEK